MIGIVNCGIGNIWSIKNKLNKLNIQNIISDEVKELENCEKLILPGVGHFDEAIINLRKNKLWDFINYQVLFERKPILGICLGMQIMCRKSEEGKESGFNWFDTEVVRFEINEPLRYKVPHIGWNGIIFDKGENLFNNINFRKNEFYFIHSFHIKHLSDDNILCRTIYENEFISGIIKDKIIGVQFHPEKSKNEGDIFLTNYCLRF